jgi:DNA-binding NarL/FixJ family response regulator
VLAPTVASTLVGLVGSSGGSGRRSQENLSPREIGVLKLVADGATNQVAARKLLVSETTIKTHLLHIYTKLGVRDRASAVAAAYKRGLIS